MSAVRMFLYPHALLHASDVGNGPSIADRTLAGLTDSEMRLRPGKGLNSIAWLMWHMARTEDVNVNLVVADGDKLTLTSSQSTRPFKADLRAAGVN